MNVSTALLNLESVSDNLNLSKMWGLHRSLSSLKKDLLELKTEAVANGWIMEAVTMETKLYFIENNIATIEVAMLAKEDDIFTATSYDLICKN